MIDGVSYDYLPNSDDTLIDVASGLDAAVGSAYDVARDGSTLTVRNGGTQFTVQVLRGFGKAADVTGTPDMNFTQFELTGEIVVGEDWSIIVNDQPVTVQAEAGDTLQSIAQKLVAEIGNQIGADKVRYNQYLDIYVIYIDPITGLPVKDVIQRRGEQASGYQETGFQLYGYAMLDAGGNQLYEDALGNLVTTNTGKPIFIIDQQDPSALPLFLDGLGRLTTADTGLQALRIIEGNQLPLAFYADNTSGQISNWSNGARLTSSDVIDPGLSPVRSLHFDVSGNKSTTDLYTENGVIKTGYQEQGYQVWGYYLYPDGTRSTTAIEAGYIVVEDFDDPRSVPLYLRYNSLGELEVNTERLANEVFDANDPSVASAYQLFLATNLDYVSGQLYQYKNANNEWVVTDDPFDGIRPYVKTYASGSVEGHAVVPLYLDQNGNLTTTPTSTPDWRRGFQRGGYGQPVVPDPADAIRNHHHWRFGIVPADRWYRDGRVAVERYPGRARCGGRRLCQRGHGPRQCIPGTRQYRRYDHHLADYSQ